MSRLSVALEHLKQGGMIVLFDDEDRENEGDLVVAGEYATPEAIRFMAVHGRGLICLALTDAQEAGTPSVHEQHSDKAGAQLMAGKKCPECGAHAMIRKDGCEYCTSCGHLGSCG